MLDSALKRIAIQVSISRTEEFELLVDMGDRESETKKLLAKLEELEREEGEIEVLELGSRNSICQEREEGEIHGDEGEEEQEQIPGRVTGSAGLYDTDAGTGFEIAGNGFVDENRPNSRKKEVADEGAPSGVVQVQAYECFIGDENGASSDMEIEEDIPSPLLRGTHVSAYFDKESTNSPVGGIESQSRNGDAKSILLILFDVNCFHPSPYRRQTDFNVEQNYGCYL